MAEGRAAGPPPFKKRMKAAKYLATALFLAGCASSPKQEMGWQKIDGTAPSQQQFEADLTVCQGETQRATLAAHPTDSIPAAFERGRARGQVFNGCMAQRGYLQRPVP